MTMPEHLNPHCLVGCKAMFPMRSSCAAAFSWWHSHDGAIKLSDAFAEIMSLFHLQCLGFLLVQYF